MELYAHTPNDRGRWHLLEDHLRAVGDLAAEHASRFGFTELGRRLGLLHDVGKASDEFQSYLRCYDAEQRGIAPPVSRTDHKLAGAQLALRLGSVCELLVLPVLGHHGGLSSPSEAKSRLKDPGVSECVSQAIRRVERVLPPAMPTGVEAAAQVRTATACEMLVRMLFSCLVDADFLDTERHWSPANASLRGASPDIPRLWSAFEAAQSQFQSEAPATPVNTIRREICDACVAAAEQPRGVFRLTVPTGGGKTRSGMAFALKHAAIHDLRRVIVAIPYTSIIDQNAAEYRSILGADNVLEHHSALAVSERDDYSEEQMRSQLACENWDSPVVVTTTVQFFESLLSNKPSRCRKLHNIAGSVVILDEVQTLPTGIVQPALDVLRQLVEHYHVTLVLSTATQPAFMGQSPYLQGFDGAVEIVPNPERHFRALQRVDYRIEQDPWSWETAAGKMLEHEQVLCVVNSRWDALTLWTLLGDPDALHLSTLMCPAHRRAALEDIGNRLKNGQTCRVVSTQVVECGVDMDFPLVMRAAGPLDRIVQAAGRCNREGLLPGKGEIVVFTPKEGHAPRGPYATAMADARRILDEPGCDLHDPDVFDKYFSLLWQDCNTDAYGIRPFREALNYPEVAARFRLIEDPTEPVIVHYGAPGPGEVLESISRQKGVAREQWRMLQQYAVSLYSSEFARCLNQGLIRKVAQNVFVWAGSYHERTGLSEDLIDPADLII